MTRIELDGENFVVPASVLAEAFDLTEDIRQEMRDGRSITRCEAGVARDAGRWHLTFRHAGRTCRIVVDESGVLL